MIRHSNLYALIAASFGLLALAPACTSSRAQNDPFARAADEQSSKPEYRLGYQLEWQGFPRVTSRKGPKFFDILGDTVVVQDPDHNLTIMEADTGRNRWAALGGRRLDNFVGNMRVEDRLVVSADTHVLIFDIQTGELLDRQRLAYLASTRPIIIDTIAIYGCTTGEILAHNLAVGYKLWAYGLSGRITASPVHLAGVDIAAVSHAGDVVILDAKEATARGRLDRVFEGVTNDPVADERAVYVASMDQSVYAFARGNGARLWRYRTESPITAQPAIHEGVVYVDVPREGLIAIDARSGEKRWSNPEIQGDVVAMRNGRLLVWDGEAFTTVDLVRGEAIETIPFPDVHMLAFDRFVDGNLYTVSRKGLVQKFGTF